MIYPAYLQSGDTIALAAPARKVSPEEIAPAVRLLEQHGFNVFYDERLFAEDHQLAGSDSLRASYFQSLLDNPHIQAIWCVRGGYGSVRIIDQLDFTQFVKNPKWIVGYSDITLFHSHIHRHYNIATLHATMPINIPANEETRTSLAEQTFLDALQGKTLRYEIPAHPLSRGTTAYAPVVGGNLSILYSLLGSPSDVPTEGKILFIEDLDEYLYHIDRMMANLTRNGKLQNLAALLVGHLSDMHDNTIPFGKTAEEIVAEYAYRYNITVLFNFPAGHLPDNRAIRMGCSMRIFNQDGAFITEN